MSGLLAFMVGWFYSVCKSSGLCLYYVTALCTLADDILCHSPCFGTCCSTPPLMGHRSSKKIDLCMISSACLFW